MTIYYPEATPALGATAVAVVQTMADPEVPDLSTDIGAASTVIATMYLYGGSLEATATQAKGEAPRRLGTTVSLPQLGLTTYDISDLRFVHDPQAADSTDDNKLKAALEPGTEVYLIVRRGPSGEHEPFAIGQYVDVWKVRCGEQNDAIEGDGDFSEFALAQSVVPVSPPVRKVQIVA